MASSSSPASSSATSPTAAGGVAVPASSSSSSSHLPSSSSLFLTSRFEDFYSRLPARLGAYGHAIAEALAPALSAGGAAAAAAAGSPASPSPSPSSSSFGRSTAPLTLLTLVYVGAASVERSRLAGQAERHPELVRKARVGAAMDSLGTLWLECVTFPSIAVGAAGKALQAAGVGGGAAGAGAGAGAGLLSPPRTLSGALLFLVPTLLMPLSSWGADAVMEWSFRPAIGWAAAYSLTPFARSLLGRDEVGRVRGLSEEDNAWVAPSAEDLLPGSPASAGKKAKDKAVAAAQGKGGKKGAGATDEEAEAAAASAALLLFGGGLMGPSMADLYDDGMDGGGGGGGGGRDPLSAAQMAWAMDGRADSAYPTREDVPAQAQAPAPAAQAAGSGAAALAEAERKYAATVLDIRRRADERKRAAEGKGGGAAGTLA